MMDPDTAEMVLDDLACLLPLPDVPGRYTLVVEAGSDDRGEYLTYRWDREAEPIVGVLEATEDPKP
jgi:hypothetical protein